MSPGALWTSQDFARPERLTQLGAALHALARGGAAGRRAVRHPAVLERHYQRLQRGAPEEARRLDRS